MLDLEIRTHLADYVSKRTSLGEFEEWFIPETWDVENQGNDAARDLTLAVMRLLVKHSNGDLTESGLRRDLGILSRTYWFDQAPKGAGTVKLSSTSEVIRPAQSVQAGTSLAAASE